MFPPNKKVGFRPLQEFDTYNSIVACPVENATWAIDGSARPPTKRVMILPAWVLWKSLGRQVLYSGHLSAGVWVRFAIQEFHSAYRSLSGDGIIYARDPAQAPIY
jgi:hypothetical protein